MLSFRQPGDMGRYVADNDPGGIAAGFSNLEDFLAAGNKIPEYMTSREPLGAANPLSGMTNAIPPTLNVTPPSVPISAQTPLPGIVDLLRPKSDDPLVQGYMDSDFYERRSTTNVVPYTYQGKEMTGSGSYASNFKKYLESIGKGDLIQFPDQGIAQQGSGPLATIERGDSMISDNNAFPIGFGSGDSRDITSTLLNQGVGQDIFANNPIEIPVPSAPQNNQFQGFDDRLTKIEEGIASLLKNRGQEFNFGMQPRFDFGMQPKFNMSGLGYFFNPQGGFYG